VRVFHLGGRDLASFRTFGILPGCTGIAVHDRYQNYFHPDWKHLAGHQICASHLPGFRSSSVLKVPESGV
jgi:transposase